MKVLIDTGATTTLINPCSFVLADGIVEVKSIFGNQITRIYTDVADNLCTNIIFGMDYISHYNLKFVTRQQFISIEYNNKRCKINCDHDIQPHFTPVILTNSIHVPLQSNRSVVVSTPISSSRSSFVPHSSFSAHNSIIVQQLLVINHIPQKRMIFMI